MDASMTMMNMASSTGMTMSPTSSSMPMSSHLTSSEMLMGMDSMAMVFFTSTSTPLFSRAWSPKTTGQYVGTCVFLIVLATIFRGLLAVRVHFFPILAMLKHKRRIRLQHKGADIEPQTRPWRAGEAISLATMDVIIAGISYLLMLAVMTMNVGYFLSILSGVFIGSVCFGHLTATTAMH